MQLLWKRADHPLIYAIAALTLIACCAVYLSVTSTNGFASFPFDDAWIHLTFARTLSATGQFAYGPLHAATAGSTSPLFTFIESLLFLFTKNEFIVALVPSIAALAIAAVAIYALIRKQLDGLAWIPLAGAIAFIASPRLLTAASWGMETTLVCALLLLAALSYERKQWTRLAITLGLLIWARPDTIMIFFALTLDYVYNRQDRSGAVSALFPGRRGNPATTSEDFVKPNRKFYIIIVLALALYVGFNLFLSGTILPNTFYAKLSYYKDNNPEYWSQLWVMFSSHGGEILTALASLGILWILTDVLKHRTTRIYLLAYPLAMIILYRVKLPYLFQDGRYLVPILPFVILLAVTGSIRTAQLLSKRASVVAIVSSLALILMAVTELTNVSDAVTNLAREDAYIYNLQVRTAEWCAQNLPSKAVIATHDIGALGFYSGHQILDLIGLANPEMIPYLKKPGPAITTALRKHGVTYAALLDNWYEIENENTLFVNDPPGSEIMRVYPVTDSSRFTLASVMPIHRYFHDCIVSGDVQDFGEAMREAIQDEPSNPLTYTLGSEVLLSQKRPEEARQLLRKALMLFPNSSRALDDLRRCYLLEGKPWSGK